MVASLEACVPLFTAPIFTLVYQQTIDYFPAAIILISAALFVLTMVNLIIVYVLVRMARPEQNIDTEETTAIINNEVINVNSGVQEIYED